MLAAGKVAIVDPFNMSRSGENRINAVLRIVPLAVVRNVLFALGSNGFACLGIVANTEVFMLLLVDAAQNAVAFQINAATLMRSNSNA